MGSLDHSKSWQRHAVRLKEEKVRAAICEETCLLERCVGFLNHLMVMRKWRIEINDMQVTSLRSFLDKLIKQRQLQTKARKNIC